MNVILIKKMRQTEIKSEGICENHFAPLKPDIAICQT